MDFMSPETRADFEEFNKNCKYIYLALSLNGIFLGVCWLILSVFTENYSMESLTNQYGDGFIGPFLMPMNEGFQRFVANFVLITPAQEELIFRFPVWIFVKRNQYLGFDEKLGLMTVAPIILFLNFAWAYEHAFAPTVFISGLFTYWLILKTKRFWPALVFHIMANVLLYFSIRTLNFFI